MTLHGLTLILEELLYREDWQVISLEGEHDAELLLSRVSVAELFLKLRSFSPLRSD